MMEKQTIRTADERFSMAQRHAIDNKEYHEYAAMFHRIVTDPELMSGMVWTIRQASEYFRVNPGTVYYWIKTGKLKAQQRLTETKNAQNDRWIWEILVSDIEELKHKYDQVSDITGRRYWIKAVLDAELRIVKERN